MLPNCGSTPGRAARGAGGVAAAHGNRSVVGRRVRARDEREPNPAMLAAPGSRSGARSSGGRRQQAGPIRYSSTTDVGNASLCARHAQRVTLLWYFPRQSTTTTTTSGPFVIATQSTSRHIGIVACSAEGAALCYRTVCTEAEALLGPRAHPEVSLHSHSFADYVACLDRGDWQSVAELMLSSAHKLAASGAQFLVCPDNTIHAALRHVQARSPLPWLHIAEVVAAEAANRGYRRVGLTGTRWLVDSDVYPASLAALGLEYLRPTAMETEVVNRIIMDELVYGDFRPGSVARLQGVIARMQDAGCDAVVLGCTEIPLIINDSNSPLPTLDSTRLLAHAALARAVRGQSAA